MKCTFCGHRDISSLSVNQLTDTIEWVINQYNITHFYCGCNGGFDLVCINAVNNLARTYRDLTNYIITPYHNNKIAEHSQPDFENCFTIYPFDNSTLPKYAIVKANRYMVDNSDIAICYINHNFGGAYATYKYAQSKNKILINLGECRN